MEDEKPICDVCDEPIESDDYIVICDGEYEYTYDGDCLVMHYGCYESETCYPRGKATLYYKGVEVKITLYKQFYFIDEDEIPEDIYEEVMPIARELAVELGGAIYWHPVDPWRGYYDIHEDDLKKWKVLHDDCILAGSEDAEMLKKFDDKLREILDKHGFIYARLTLTTSNLFSTGYTMLIRTEGKSKPEIIAVYAMLPLLKTIYRDDRRFLITALTGKTRVADFDEKDDLIVEAFLRIKNGEDPNKVTQDIINKLTGGQ